MQQLQNNYLDAILVGYSISRAMHSCMTLARAMTLAYYLYHPAADMGNIFDQLDIQVPLIRTYDACMHGMLKIRVGQMSRNNRKVKMSNAILNNSTASKYLLNIFQSWCWV